MEISQLKGYARKPTTGAFPVGNSTVAVEWDKAAFTGRFIAALYDEAKRKQAEVLTEVKALKDEFAAADKADDLDARIEVLTAKRIHLDARLEEIEQEIYARALADDVLLSWGFTSGGDPVPVSFEFLMSQPRQFAADLFAFCRRESLPKFAQKKTSGTSRTTRETSRSSSVETRSTRRRKGRRSSTTPTSSPSPAASASPSPNSTAG